MFNKYIVTPVSSTCKNTYHHLRKGEKIDHNEDHIPKQNLHKHLSHTNNTMTGLEKEDKGIIHNSDDAEEFKHI